MNFERIVEQRIAAASHHLNVTIERAALSVLHSLGLQASYDFVTQAKKQMAEESPLYVDAIVLRGQECRDMYDDHPGFCFFYTDASRTMEVPPYCRLSKAMEISLQMLAEAQQESDTNEEYDGLFIASSIVLLDQMGNTIQEYTNRYLGNARYSEGWMDELPSQDEWVSLEEKAKALDSEGSYESGWDNHETGRQLHAQANSLRRRIQMAKSQSRIIQ